jgi:putative ABC transport system substrate-binding protein
MTRQSIDLRKDLFAKKIDARVKPAHDGVRRREFITLLAGGAAAWPLAARAQPKRSRRIGVLMGLVASDPEAQSRVDAFENGLRELGWVKGRNLSIEYRWAGDGNVARDHAAQLLAMAPDLIVANSTPVTWHYGSRAGPCRSCSRR